MESTKDKGFLQPQQQTVANRRKEKDVMKLLVSDYDVVLPNENNNSEFVVKLKGPVNSIYEGVSKSFI